MKTNCPKEAFERMKAGLEKEYKKGMPWCRGLERLAPDGPDIQLITAFTKAFWRWESFYVGRSEGVKEAFIVSIEHELFVCTPFSGGTTWHIYHLGDDGQLGYSSTEDINPFIHELFADDRIDDTTDDIIIETGTRMMLNAMHNLWRGDAAELYAALTILETDKDFRKSIEIARQEFKDILKGGEDNGE